MCDRLDIGTLTFGLRRAHSGLLDRLESLLKLCRGLKPGCEGITPTTQCDAPICGGTGGVAYENRVEGLNGIPKLKRVHQSHSAIELRLNYAAARCVENYAAQRLMRPVVVVSLRMTHTRCQQCNGRNKQACNKQGKVYSHRCP